MKRSVKVLVIKAVCKCIDVSDLNAKASCSEAQCEGAYDKAVRRCHDVSNVEVLGAAWGYVLERRSVKAHVAGAVRR